METKIIKIDRYKFDKQDLKEAAEILKAGGLVAFPTETVYGLGADGLKEEASSKIFSAKGRPCDNPLIIHIADIDALKVLTKTIPEKGFKLAKQFWPGPLTLIFDKSKTVPYSTTGGLETIAIRMPSHPIAYELIRTSGVYVAAPSANTSGRPSPTRAEHVADDLGGKIDYIIDGGKVDIGLESTIVDVTGSTPVVLRPGYITTDMIEDVVTIDLVGMVEVMLWETGEFILAENAVHIEHLELGRTLDMIDLVVNIMPSIGEKCYKLS